MRLLSFPELKPKGIPWCRDHVRRKCAADTFPKPVQISDSRIAWIEAEIDEWIAQRVAERDGKVALPEPTSAQANLPDDDQAATSSQHENSDRVRPIGAGRLRGGGV